MRFAFWYSTGLLLGVILGLLFPAIPSWPLFFLGLFVIVLVTEGVGSWGFGSHWTEYRSTVYLVYSPPFVLLLVGALLGSGKIGALLVSVGTLLIF
jgi:hypothetical protein